MRGNRRGCRPEGGSITVEAAVVIGILVPVLLSMLLLFHVIRIQALMRQALHETALAYADRLSALSVLIDLRDPLAPLEERLDKAGLDKEEVNALLGSAGDFVSEHALLTPLFERFYGGGAPGALERSDIDNGAAGLEWDERVDVENRAVKLELFYGIRLPGLLAPLGPLECAHSAGAGLWLSKEAENAPFLEEKEKPEEKSSIWDETSFKRGRYFAEKYRSKEASPLKKGRGFDSWAPPGALEQVCSLNVFGKSYSENVDGSYVLKPSGVLKQLRSLVRSVEKNSEKWNSVITEDGTEIPLTGGEALSLCVIVPEEARQFSGELERLAREAEANGVTIRFEYDEPAYPGEPKEEGE